MILNVHRIHWAMRQGNHDLKKTKIVVAIIACKRENKTVKFDETNLSVQRCTMTWKCLYVNQTYTSTVMKDAS